MEIRKTKEITKEDTKRKNNFIRKEQVDLDSDLENLSSALPEQNSLTLPSEVQMKKARERKLEKVSNDGSFPREIKNVKSNKRNVFDIEKYLMPLKSRFSLKDHREEEKPPLTLEEISDPHLEYYKYKISYNELQCDNVYCPDEEHWTFHKKSDPIKARKNFVLFDFQKGSISKLLENPLFAACVSEAFYDEENERVFVSMKIQTGGGFWDFFVRMEENFKFRAGRWEEYQSNFKYLVNSLNMTKYTFEGFFLEDETKKEIILHKRSRHKKHSKNDSREYCFPDNYTVFEKSHQDNDESVEITGRKRYLDSEDCSPPKRKQTKIYKENQVESKASFDILSWEPEKEPTKYQNNSLNTNPEISQGEFKKYEKYISTQGPEKYDYDPFLWQEISSNPPNGFKPINTVILKRLFDIMETNKNLQDLESLGNHLANKESNLELFSIVLGHWKQIDQAFQTYIRFKHSNRKEIDVKQEEKIENLYSEVSTGLIDGIDRHISNGIPYFKVS